MEEKKKILFVITKGNFGGAQKYVYDLATNLPNNKFEVSVACGSQEGTTLIEKIEEINSKRENSKIKIFKLENSQREIKARSDLKSFKEILALIHSENSDIVHLNSSKIGVLGSLAVLTIKISRALGFKKFSKTPKCIFTAHGWAFNENDRSTISKFVFYLGHFLTVAICDTTIAVSEKAKNDISLFPFVQDKIQVIYNGISEKDFSFEFSKEKAREILAKEKQDRKIILSISELHKNKGVDVALKALAMLPEEYREKIFYSIAGSGEEEKNLKKLAKDLNIFENSDDKKNAVNFLSYVQDAKKLIIGSDIFLLPSRTEALPYAILEAGFVGKPIIATSVGGVPEILHDMQNGILIHPRNPKEIAEAIMYLLDRPEKMEEFGQEIKKTIGTFFSLEKMLSETISVY